jgi:hypothetical protein
MTLDLTMKNASVKLPEAPVATPVLRKTARRSILVHDDFVNWLLDEAEVQPQFRKKARHQLQSLLAYGYAKGSKSVVGEARGWLRAPLGGSGGFQFYLWYATHLTSVGKAFGLSEREVLVRVVRHHDETSRGLDAESRDRYEVLTERDIDVTSTDDSTYSQTQRSVVGPQAAPIQIIRGYPGSGKTTSLFLSYLHARPGRALYLTHSGRLADSAREFFDAFSPEDVSVEVMRFDELLDYLRDDPPDTNLILTPSDGADRMMEMLESSNNKWHQLVGERKDDWYAELHAFAVGRNLPLEFRDIPANSGVLLDAKAYVKLRKPDIGREADDIAQILEPLSLRPDLVDLFRGPIRSRELLMDQFEPPPPRLENLVTVLVDEVQDLTPVELLLIFNVISRSANASGKLPRIVLAGDESQTVRPSGFEWPVVNELIQLVFGDRVERRDEIPLDENMRSSVQIATFVEATRDQYLKFMKRDRPGGINYTRANESLSGRLMYCQLASDEDMNKLGELMAELPRSVIVYPGHRLPVALPTDVADRTRTANEVKGLDFDTVVLLDAGERQMALDELLARQDSRPSSGVAARVLADQYRVAASRATENLILVDRGPKSLQSVVEGLSRKAGLESLEVVPVDDIPVLLGDELNPEDVIRNLLEEVRRVVSDDPKRARQRYLSAKRQLERARLTQTIADDVVEEARRLGCVTAIANVLHIRDLSSGQRKHLSEEAVQSVPNPTLSDAVEALFVLRSDATPSLTEHVIQALVTSSSNLDQVKLLLPEVARFQEQQLRYWIDQCEKDLTPGRSRTRERQAALAVKAVTTTLKPRFPEYQETCDNIIGRWAEGVIHQEQFEDALALLRELEARRPALEGAALRGLKKYREAAIAFSDAGEYRQAVLMAREIPDHALATDLATRGDQALMDETMWVVQLLRASEPLPTGVVPLTEAEQSRLTSAIRPVTSLAGSRAIPSELSGGRMRPRQ